MKASEVTGGVHLINQLKSSFLTTLVMAYAYKLNEAQSVIRQLSRKGTQFAENNAV